MQSIIMAAGKGNRISKITDGKPKCYLKINGESLIERQLRIIRSYGIKDIIIVTGYQKERFERDFSAPDVRFAFNPFFENTNVLASFWCGQHLLHENFVYLHADTIFHEQIFNDMISKAGDIVLPIDFKTCVEEDMKVKIIDKHIVEINKTMASEIANGEFIGIAKINSNAIPALKQTVEEAMKDKKFDMFFEYAIQKLIDVNAVKVQPISTKDYPWNEIDFVEDFKNAAKLFG